MTVKYEPLRESDSPGTLTVRFNDTDSLAIELAGVAREAVGALQVLPPIGKICVQETRPTVLRLTSNKGASFRVDAITNTSVEHEPFVIVAPTLPFVLQGNGANFLDAMVDIKPTSLAPLTISYATDIPRKQQPSTPLVTFTLDAEILPLGVSGPATTKFGTAKVDSRAPAVTVQVSNCSTEPVEIIRAALSNDAFAIINPGIMTIPPRGHVDFEIAMDTSSAGGKVAVFTVETSDGGTAEMELNGEVLQDRGTYYACAAGPGQVGGLELPCLIVWLGLRRRRRNSPGDVRVFRLRS